MNNEEKLINGIVYCRFTPSGKFQPKIIQSNNKKKSNPKTKTNSRIFI
jgi:hypothetical protein